MALIVKHRAFVAALANDPSRFENRMDAIARAYHSVYPGTRSMKNAYASGMRLLQRPDVADELQRREEEQAEAAGITADEVVRDITLLAKADPRGLVEVHRGACRYCYGLNHLYQRTPRELRAAMESYLKANGAKDPNAVFFDHEGGIGFNATRPPHPECPECFGLGEVYEYLKDSRTWTQGAARLFAGVERTREGLKVKTRSQDRALKLAADLHHLTRAPEEGAGDNTPPPSEIVYNAQDASRPGRKR